MANKCYIGKDLKYMRDLVTKLYLLNTNEFYFNEPNTKKHASINKQFKIIILEMKETEI